MGGRTTLGVELSSLCLVHSSYIGWRTGAETGSVLARRPGRGQRLPMVDYLRTLLASEAEGFGPTAGRLTSQPWNCEEPGPANRPAARAPGSLPWVTYPPPAIMSGGSGIEGWP